MKPYYYVIPLQPVTQYSDLESAQADASRLAQASPGIHYEVLKCVATVSCPLPDITTDGIGKQKNGWMEVGSGIAETIPIVHKLSMENWTETNNMNTPINDGGPAFPVENTYHQNGQVEYGAWGMSLRDWFAGQALAGMVIPDDGKFSLENWRDSLPKRHARNRAEIAYRHADAMIAARKDGVK
jgi:hypothetical protein